MKKNKLIAAILFGVLAIVQFFGVSYILNTSLSQVPILLLVEIVALAVYVMACVKYFKTLDVAFTAGEKRSAAALCVMYFAAIALNLKMFTSLLGVAVAQFSQELAMKPSTGNAMLIFRTALLFAALCFVIFNEKAPRVATVEFEEAVSPEKLETAEAVEEIIEKPDSAEQ